MFYCTLRFYKYTVSISVSTRSEVRVRPIKPGKKETKRFGYELLRKIYCTVNISDTFLSEIKLKSRLKKVKIKIGCLLTL